MQDIESGEISPLKLEDILDKGQQITPAQNRMQRRNELSYEKTKTKSQLIYQIKLLQAYVYELVNNPDSDFANTIKEGVKIQ
jgi:hypothetical protein